MVTERFDIGDYCSSYGGNELVSTIDTQQQTESKMTYNYKYYGKAMLRNKIQCKAR